MKRYIRAKRSQHIELELIAVLADTFDYPVTTSQHDIELEYRELPKEYELSQEQLSKYKNFVRTMASIIVNSGFEITEEYQSPKSYSYYLKFTPEPYEGILENDVDRSIPRKTGTDFILDVKIRLSDHYVHPEDETAISDSIGRSKTSGTVFDEFVVAGVATDSINTAIKELHDICQDLKVGDYTKLFE